MASTRRIDDSGESEVFAALQARYADDPEATNYRLLMDATDLVCREMEAQGITRRELAARLGVSPQYVTKFLNTPSNTTLLQVVRFAHALGLEVINPIVARSAAKQNTRRPIGKSSRPARRAAVASP